MKKTTIFLFFLILLILAGNAFSEEQEEIKISWKTGNDVFQPTETTGIYKYEYTSGEESAQHNAINWEPDPLDRLVFNFNVESEQKTSFVTIKMYEKDEYIYPLPEVFINGRLCFTPTKRIKYRVHYYDYVQPITEGKPEESEGKGKLRFNLMKECGINFEIKTFVSFNKQEKLTSTEIEEKHQLRFIESIELNKEKFEEKKEEIEISWVQDKSDNITEISTSVFNPTETTDIYKYDYIFGKSSSPYLAINPTEDQHGFTKFDFTIDAEQKALVTIKFTEGPKKELLPRVLINGRECFNPYENIKNGIYYDNIQPIIAGKVIREDRINYIYDQYWNFNLMEDCGINFKVELDVSYRPSNQSRLGQIIQPRYIDEIELNKKRFSKIAEESKRPPSYANQIRKLIGDQEELFFVDLKGSKTRKIGESVYFEHELEKMKCVDSAYIAYNNKIKSIYCITFADLDPKNQTKNFFENYKFHVNTDQHQPSKEEAKNPEILKLESSLGEAKVFDNGNLVLFYKNPTLNIDYENKKAECFLEDLKVLVKKVKVGEPKFEGAYKGTTEKIELNEIQKYLGEGKDSEKQKSVIAETVFGKYADGSHDARSSRAPTQGLGKKYQLHNFGPPSTVHPNSYPNYTSISYNSHYEIFVSEKNIKLLNDGKRLVLSLDGTEMAELSLESIYAGLTRMDATLLFRFPLDEKTPNQKYFLRNISFKNTDRKVAISKKQKSFLFGGEIPEQFSTKPVYLDREEIKFSYKGDNYYLLFYGLGYDPINFSGKDLKGIEFERIYLVKEKTSENPEVQSELFEECIIPNALKRKIEFKPGELQKEIRININNEIINTTACREKNEITIDHSKATGVFYKNRMYFVFSIKPSTNPYRILLGTAQDELVLVITLAGSIETLKPTRIVGELPIILKKTNLSKKYGFIPEKKVTIPIDIEVFGESQVICEGEESNFDDLKQISLNWEFEDIHRFNPNNRSSPYENTCEVWLQGQSIYCDATQFSIYLTKKFDSMKTFVNALKLEELEKENIGKYCNLGEKCSSFTDIQNFWKILYTKKKIGEHYYFKKNKDQRMGGHSSTGELIIDWEDTLKNEAIRDLGHYIDYTISSLCQQKGLEENFKEKISVFAKSLREAYFEKVKNDPELLDYLMEVNLEDLTWHPIWNTFEGDEGIENLKNFTEMYKKMTEEKEVEKVSYITIEKYIEFMEEMKKEMQENENFSTQHLAVLIDKSRLKKVFREKESYTEYEKGKIILSGNENKELFKTSRSESKYDWFYSIHHDDLGKFNVLLMQDNLSDEFIESFVKEYEGKTLFESVIGIRRYTFEYSLEDFKNMKISKTLKEKMKESPGKHSIQLNYTIPVTQEIKIEEKEAKIMSDLVDEALNEKENQFEKLNERLAEEFPEFEKITKIQYKQNEEGDFAELTKENFSYEKNGFVENVLKETSPITETEEGETLTSTHFTFKLNGSREKTNKSYPIVKWIQTIPVKKAIFKLALNGNTGKTGRNFGITINETNAKENETYATQGFENSYNFVSSKEDGKGLQEINYWKAINQDKTITTKEETNEKWKQGTIFELNLDKQNNYLAFTPTIPKNLRIEIVTENYTGLDLQLLLKYNIFYNDRKINFGTNWLKWEQFEWPRKWTEPIADSLNQENEYSVNLTRALQSNKSAIFKTIAFVPYYSNEFKNAKISIKADARSEGLIRIEGLNEKLQVLQNGETDLTELITNKKDLFTGELISLKQTTDFSTIQKLFEFVKANEKTGIACITSNENNFSITWNQEILKSRS